MMTSWTAKAELADELLKRHGGLEEFVAARRLRFRPVTWEAVARQLAEATDRRIHVSALTLRTWFRDADEARRRSTGPVSGAGAADTERRVS